MADFVAQNGFHFVAAHVVEQAGGYRDQRVVLVRARGEGVRIRRIEDADFRHADAGRLGLRAHRVHEPLLGLGARLGDDLNAHGHLGRPLRNEQRDECAAEAEHGREDEQGAEVESLLGEVAVESENRDHDGQHHHDGDVGGDEQGDAFHGL
jgi:hypothetical protein